LPEKIRRRAAQDQKPRAHGLAIRQHAQHREQLRTALHFIQHYDAFQALKCKHWVGEPRDISRILQIKSGAVIAYGRRDQACERCFSNLTRTEQCDYGESLQKADNPPYMQIAIYHSRHITMKIQCVSPKFHGQ
jgi:hypothetical protein